MKNKFSWIVTVVILLIAIGGYLYPQVVPFGASAGPEHYGLEQFLGGFLRGNTVSTSTSVTVTAATLTANELVGRDTVLYTPNLGATTLTFPASSTLKSLVPKAGQMQETCFLNATSTAAATIKFAAGTGIDIEMASTSPNGGSAGLVATAVIPANGTGCFKFIRQKATATTFDITALYTVYSNAD